jgi:hypothetical protein
VRGCLRCLTADCDLAPLAPDGVCRRCGQRWRRPKLLAVSGATGVGKSTVCAALPTVSSACVPLDAELLWRSRTAEFGAAVVTAPLPLASRAP